MMAMRSPGMRRAGLWRAAGAAASNASPESSFTHANRPPSCRSGDSWFGGGGGGLGSDRFGGGLHHGRRGAPRLDRERGAAFSDEDDADLADLHHVAHLDPVTHGALLDAEPRADRHRRAERDE